MSVHKITGHIVVCDDCGKTLEAEGNAVIFHADSGLLLAEIEAFGWERWEDDRERCPDCISAALRSGDWELTSDTADTPHA